MWILFRSSSIYMLINTDNRRDEPRANASGTLSSRTDSKDPGRLEGGEEEGAEALAPGLSRSGLFARFRLSLFLLRLVLFFLLPRCCLRLPFLL